MNTDLEILLLTIGWLLCGFITAKHTSKKDDGIEIGFFMLLLLSGAGGLLCIISESTVFKKKIKL